jgi:threonine/homoserine/homoserine lactone efflux protein
MALHVWLAFVAATAVLLVIPGPTVLLAIGDALASRRQQAWCTVLGVGLGDAMAMTLSLAGAGALLRASATAFTVMKTIGGVYLIYLGAKSIMSARQNDGEVEEERELKAPRSGRARFFRAWAVTVLNPKSILFFIAFVPQFLSPAAPFLLQAGILLPTFVLMAMVNVSIYMSLAGMIGAKLNGAAAQRKVHYAGGGTLIAAGTLTLALKHR